LPSIIKNNANFVTKFVTNFIVNFRQDVIFNEIKHLDELTILTI